MCVFLCINIYMGIWILYYCYYYFVSSFAFYASFKKKKKKKEKESESYIWVAERKPFFVGRYKINMILDRK